MKSIRLRLFIAATLASSVAVLGSSASEQAPAQAPAPARAAALASTT